MDPRRIIHILILAVLATGLSLRLSAQDMRTADQGRGDYGIQQNNTSSNPFDTPEDGEGEENQKQDSVKKKRPKKPLESFFFPDSIRARTYFTWTTDLKTNNVNMGSIDTLADDFQVDFPYLKQGVGDAYLGNLGAGSVPLNFFDRRQYRDFAFTQTLFRYITTPANARFFNAKKPFTQLGYISAGQKKYMEENFSALHAQNVSPSTGFNVDYHSLGTRGIYTRQKTRDKDMSLVFSHTGKRYSAQGGYVYNSINMRENGGLVSDWDITDTVYEVPENVPMRLADANNKLRNNAFFVVQSFGVPLARMSEEDFTMADKPAFYIGHAFEYNKWNRVYSDAKSGSGDYYSHWYINPTTTRDSIAERLIANRLFLQIQPWDRDGIVGVIDAGIGLDNHRYYQFELDQYYDGNVKGVTRNDYYAYGSVKGKFRKYFDWGADARMVPAGYRSGDLEVGGNADLSLYIKQRPITLSGQVRFSRLTPSYWSENYFSNHFVWNNSFAKETETRAEIRLSAPYYKIEAVAFQSVLGNRVFYGADCMPQQSSNVVSVTGVYLRKDFRLGIFNFNNRALLQWSTDQTVAPVPLVSVYGSYFLQIPIVKQVLTVRVGIDARYNTKYYAFGYNPAIGQFYNQREKEIGNYVMADAFVSAKWKRMRILVKYQHLNEGWFNTREYFTVLHYPLNRRVFKFGISWAFYD